MKTKHSLTKSKTASVQAEGHIIDQAERKCKEGNFAAVGAERSRRACNMHASGTSTRVEFATLVCRSVVFKGLGLVEDEDDSMGTSEPSEGARPNR